MENQLLRYANRSRSNNRSRITNRSRVRSSRISRSYVRDPTYNSFTQCNNALYDMEELDLHQYLQVVRSIPYDNDLIKYSIYPDVDQTWIESIIEFMINISPCDPRAFTISLSSLCQIGIDGLEDRKGVSNFFCKLINRDDDGLSKEKRFLKTNKLVENVDYITISSEVDGDFIDLRHDITRAAVYRLISKYFGIQFLEAILARMGQILFYFDEYKTKYKCKRIESLDRTIYGLNNDIALLTEEMNSKRDRSLPTIINCGTSFEVANQYENDDIVRSESTAVLNDHEYQDEVSTIHHLIETSINKVDNRISDINVALSNITSKIDELVGSIHLSTDVLAPGKDDSPYQSDDSFFKDSHTGQSWSGNKGSLDSDFQFFGNSYSPVAQHFKSIFNKTAEHNF